MIRLLQRLYDRLAPIRDDRAGYSHLDHADGLGDLDELTALMDAVHGDDLDRRIAEQRDAANKARRLP